MGTYFAATRTHSHRVYQEVLDEDSSHDDPSGCPGQSGRSFFDDTVHDCRKLKRREPIAWLFLSRHGGGAINTENDLPVHSAPV